MRNTILISCFYLLLRTAEIPPNNNTQSFFKDHVTDCTCEDCFIGRRIFYRRKQDEKFKNLQLKWDKENDEFKKKIKIYEKRQNDWEKQQEIWRRLNVQEPAGLNTENLHHGRVDDMTNNENEDSQQESNHSEDEVPIPVQPESFLSRMFGWVLRGITRLFTAANRTNTLSNGGYTHPFPRANNQQEEESN